MKEELENKKALASGLEEKTSYKPEKDALSSFSSWKKEVDASIASSPLKNRFVDYCQNRDEKECHSSFSKQTEKLPYGLAWRNTFKGIEVPRRIYVMHGVTALNRYAEELYQNQDETFSVSHFVIRPRGKTESLPYNEAKNAINKEIQKILKWRLARQNSHKGDFFSFFMGFSVGSEGLHGHMFLVFDKAKFRSGYTFEKLLNDSEVMSCCSALDNRKVRNLDKMTKEEFVKWASYAVKFEGQDKLGFRERAFFCMFPVNPKEFALRRSQFGQSVAWRKGCPSKFDVQVLVDRKKKAEEEGKPFSLPSFVFEGLPLLVESASRGSLEAREVLSFALVAFPELKELPCVCGSSRGFSALSVASRLFVEARESLSVWVELLFGEFFGSSGSSVVLSG